jgi:biopolymer transport protein ExbB/TolQ
MNEIRERARRYRRAMIVTGTVMVVAPVLGLAVTVGGMMGAFETVETSGVSDPGMLSKNIGEVLIGTAIGLGVAILLLPAFIILSLLMYREKRKLEMRLEPPGQPPSWQDESP